MVHDFLNQTLREIREYRVHAAGKPVAFDFETTGLYPHKGAEIISIALSDGEHHLFVNFNENTTNGVLENAPAILGMDSIQHVLGSIFELPVSAWVAHNAKFEMNFLKAYGIHSLSAPLYCTMVMARVVYNDHMSYSLDACAKRIGKAKDDRVMEHMLKHKLWHWDTIPGKKTRAKNFHYDLVPHALLREYNIADCVVTMDVYHHQQERFREWNATARPIREIVELETQTLQVLSDMETTGIRLDTAYVNRAIESLNSTMATVEARIRELTGREFLDSGKHWKEVFDSMGLKYGRTEKGNASFDDEALSANSDELSKLILEYREAKKSVGSFFSSFLYYVGNDQRIHTSYRQSGTLTGRFSASAPNVQQLTASDTQWPVRRAFVAGERKSLISLDYQQMEFVVFLDYAGAMKTIEKVRGGMDVHSATAETMGIERKLAKTVTFLIVYGGGPKKLASTLGVSEAQGKQLLEQYYRNLPEVRHFMYGGHGQYGVNKAAENRGFIYNKYGRRCFYPNKQLCYRATNHVIQSTCADTMRKALIGVHKFLQEQHPDASLLLSIHDEFVIECPTEKALDVSRECARIMSGAFQGKHLSLKVSAEIGPNLHDMSELKL